MNNINKYKALYENFLQDKQFVSESKHRVVGYSGHKDNCMLVNSDRFSELLCIEEDSHKQLCELKYLRELLKVCK